ncbi:SMC-Scp complex subunit ScpB [Dactylosporangium sp. NPDC050588]|uniref:SMC-Scp complex subunit ScpB n=1 Tax=Dactylosporangium sp. NPDC050588 TaxID=3157211 RepID=UPI0033F07EB1
MSQDDQSRSLADQAANWVPPWARPQPPAEQLPVEEPAAVEAVEEPAAEEVAEEPAAGDAVSGEASVAEAATEPEPEPEVVEEPPAEEAPVAEPEVAVVEEAAPEDVIESVVAESAAEEAPVAEPEAGVVEEAATEEAPVAEPEVAVVEEAAAEEVVEAAAEDAPAGEADEPAVDSGALFEVPAAAVPEPKPEPEPEPVPVMSESELRGAIEAILLIVDEPATEITLAQVLDQPVDRIRGVLEDIARQYTQLGLGFDLRRVAGGWRLYTRAEFAPYVEKFVLDGQQIRLTQAALETLAVVAYKQPVTRSRISAIRGVNCDGVVRTLVTRGLIEETGSEPESGAFLYRTTSLFLEKLGLDSVDQLPPLAPFLPDDIDEIADAQR